MLNACQSAVRFIAGRQRVELDVLWQTAKTASPDLSVQL